MGSPCNVVNNRFMNSLDKSRVVIVGCGLFGLTIARRIVEDLDQEVLIIDKRDHIGGNAWSYDDPETGIEIHKYGSHLFHTSNLNVWNFVNRFSSFSDYKHKVYSVHQEQIYPMPINLATISQFFGKVFTPEEAERLLESEMGIAGEAVNLEQKAIKLVGTRLYEAFIKGYTAKQWQTDPKLLPPEIISRLPVRFNFDNSYFDDTYQGLPMNGYHDLLGNLANHPKISIQLNTDYFDLRDRIREDQLLVFTGPIDAFFDFSLGKLSWRTLDFEVETKDCSDFQGTSVVNYSDETVPFTRIHEFRHFHPKKYKEVSKTVIMREYSRFATSESDEPYYPVNTPNDRELLLRYREMANELQNVIFGGRLGTYQYLDMHMAIASALSKFETEFKIKYEKLNYK
jgi:UDP-galactopyranose mutase